MTFFTNLRPVAPSPFRGTVRSTRSWPRKFFATSNPELAPLPLGKLEALSVGAAFSAGIALLDFQGPADLTAWLIARARTNSPNRRRQDSVQPVQDLDSAVGTAADVSRAATVGASP